MSVLLGQILDALGGELVGGDREMPISRIAPLDSAGAGDLSFLSNPRYRQQLAASEAASVLADSHVIAGLVGFGFASFAICWAWINFSWFSSAYDTDDWLFRIVTMCR